MKVVVHGPRWQVYEVSRLDDVIPGGDRGEKSPPGFPSRAFGVLGVRESPKRKPLFNDV